MSLKAARILCGLVNFVTMRPRTNCWHWRESEGIWGRRKVVFQRRTGFVGIARESLDTIHTAGVASSKLALPTNLLVLKSLSFLATDRLFSWLNLRISVSSLRAQRGNPLLSLRAQRGNPGAMDCRAALAMTRLPSSQFSKFRLIEIQNNLHRLRTITRQGKGAG